MKVDKETYENFIVVWPPSGKDITCDQFVSFCMRAFGHDWKKEGASAIVLDGFTQMSRLILKLVAIGNKGTGSNLTIGDDKAKVVVSQREDYSAAYNAIFNILDEFLDQPMHRFLTGLPREFSVEIKRGNKVELVPSLTTMDMVGSKYSPQMGGPYDQYLYLRTYSGGFEALTQPEGVIRAKLRDDNPLGTLSLPVDREGLQKKFWDPVAKTCGITWDQPEGNKVPCFFNMAVYGDSGAGKSRLVTSLPNEIFERGRVVVIAFDRGSGHLQSTPSELKKPPKESK